MAQYSITIDGAGKTMKYRPIDIYTGKPIPKKKDDEETLTEEDFIERLKEGTQ